MNTKQIGDWAFIGGVLLAIVLGIAGMYVSAYENMILQLLIILGLIVGFVNVKQKQAVDFLVAAIALLAIGGAGLGSLEVVGPFIAPIITYIATFVAPAAVIVALKAIYDLASKGA
jgi:hydrogenase/urease accessory protein HupE